MSLLLDRYTTTVEFHEYAAIREALLNPDLSRRFDGRSYEDGNIRDGVVSISHGSTHRARRRVENTQFRPEALRLYESELFPQVLSRLLDRLIHPGSVDLFELGELVSVVLAARRAGVDHDPDSIEDLRALVRYVDAFSQGSAILDARDPEAVRRLVRAALEDFEQRFIRPSWERRAALVDAHRRGEASAEELPQDILTVLLLHRDDPKLELDTDGRVVREVATYLQGGTHTSSQTLINTLDLLFPIAEEDPTILERFVADRSFGQRCVHETLRLRPTTPRMKRRAEADTEVAGTAIPKDALVILNIGNANRDAGLFGPAPDAFNPDRPVVDGVPRWGLSFGAGPHQCPGRSVAGGFPVPPNFQVDDGHLFGLVAHMVREIIERGVRPDDKSAPEQDTRTERHTRWRFYPVVFEPA